MLFILRVIASLTEVSCFTRSTHIKSADTEPVSTKGTCTRSFCIETACIGDTRGTFIRGTGVRGTDEDIFLMQLSLSDTKGAYIGNTRIGNTYSRGTSISNIFTKGADTNAGNIKYLGINLQSFRILEVKLLNTRLEIKVGVC